jgi:hypothetical protein
MTEPQGKIDKWTTIEAYFNTCLSVIDKWSDRDRIQNKDEFSFTLLYWGGGYFLTFTKVLTTYLS